MTNNNLLNFSSATIALLDAIRVAMLLANAAEVHAPQASTYGDLANTFQAAIARSFRDATYCSSSEADAIAKALYWSMLDNGEDFSYNLDLYTSGRISL